MNPAQIAQADRWRDAAKKYLNMTKQGRRQAFDAILGGAEGLAGRSGLFESQLAKKGLKLNDDVEEEGKQRWEII